MRHLQLAESFRKTNNRKVLLSFRISLPVMFVRWQALTQGPSLILRTPALALALEHKHLEHNPVLAVRPFPPVWFLLQFPCSAVLCFLAGSSATAGLTCALDVLPCQCGCGNRGTKASPEFWSLGRWGRVPCFWDPLDLRALVGDNTEWSAVCLSGICAQVAAPSSSNSVQRVR